jgi:hypothetical protein
LRRKLATYYGTPHGTAGNLEAFWDYAYLLAAAPIRDSVRRAAGTILAEMAKRAPTAAGRLCLENHSGKICADLDKPARVSELQWWLEQRSAQYPGFAPGRLIDRVTFEGTTFKTA